MDSSIISNSSMKKLKDLWYERSTVAGLFVFAVILNGILCPIGAWLFNILKDIKFFNPEALLVFLFTIMILIFIANMLLVIVWRYWRSLPKFQPYENSILFAPHYNLECAKLVQSIYEMFVFELKRRVPSEKIKTTFLPQHWAVKNSDEAHHLLIETGARLIVYGDIDQGKKDGEVIKGFKNVSFTLRHRDLREWERKAVAEDLVSALAYRAFTVKETNSFIENDVVANNLSEVALFFVALALTLESNLDIAIDILRELHLNIDKSLKFKKNAPHFKNFLQAIRRCYSVALDAKFTKFYDANLVGNVTNRDHDEQFLYGQKLLTELVKIDPGKSSFHLRQAIFDLHFGDVDQAFKNISKAKNLTTANDPAPHFSFAFLCLWKKQYKRAINEYSKVLITDNHYLNVYGPVLDFIQSFNQRFPDRPEFIFSLGFMNQNFYDISKAIEDYSLFLKKTDGKNEYTPLVDYTKKQLNMILSKEQESLYSHNI